MGDEAMPLGRFSPVSGLWIDRTAKSIRITGQMELYGDEATAERAASIERSINDTWTQAFPDGHIITCNITVRLKGSGGTGPAAWIEASKMRGPSNVNPMFFRKMSLNANEADAFTWTAAHEFGHVIGLKDRYSESILSKLKGSVGWQRTSTVEAGYQGNLMAVQGGYISGQNAADLIAENQPSPHWINNDDHVRDWVKVRSAAQIGRLSAADKLKAIKTLMRGWISGDDMKSIAKICASVNTPAESRTIQKGIDCLDFTSIGQRSEMRAIFTKMPGGWVR